jgi:hypothetical protein
MMRKEILLKFERVRASQLLEESAQIPGRTMGWGRILEAYEVIPLPELVLPN